MEVKYNLAQSIQMLKKGRFPTFLKDDFPAKLKNAEVNRLKIGSALQMFTQL